MTTEYTDIYDLFLQRIKDWKLETFYQADEDGFNEYLQGFLLLSIPFFSPFCDQSLSERDDTAGTFDADLTLENEEILSLQMVKKWLEKETQDIRQMSLHIADRDFKTYSEAQNLRAKDERLITVSEEISQRVTEYSWYRADFESWINGTFISGG